jgi:NADH-quinone oxidoreductase subunit G
MSDGGVNGGGVKGDRITVTIDGREVSARPGELVIKVAEDNGVYIPRFCWHERMKPVGMCRMCLVEIEGQRGLPPACTATCADGMVVKTDTPMVKKAQEGVLEFLLINHPLDCPVCDRGGECPLQDMTFGFGPGESRFVEEKRHFAKPIAISDLVLLDRERCILCARCTRFADEIAGDPLISFVDRGGSSQVLTFPDEPFTSYFSGNTVQLCPVGALLAAPYRFRARPWDLSSVETSCQGCAMGCRVALQSSANRLVRTLGVDSEPINHGWLCDKGRFAFDFVHHPDRIDEPVVRDASGAPTETTWPQALDDAAAGLRAALDKGGPDSIALIGGARGTNEDAYAWARFAKGVLRTDNVDCQMGDGLPAELISGVPRARISDADTAKAIVFLAPDVKEELGVLYLRLRRAAVELKVPFIDLAPVTHGLSRYASVRLTPEPGAADVLAERLAAAVTAGGAPTGDAGFDRAASLLSGGGEIVVVLGRGSLAEPAGPVARAAAALARIPGVSFLSALRRGNVHGAIDLGLAPGMLPGRVSLDAGRSWFTEAWGGVPERRGADTQGILEAAAEGRIEALILLGADPLSDFPDRDLARRALERVPFILSVDAFDTESTRRARIVLPVALYGETRGTMTNLEGRLLRLARKVAPPGTAMEDWRIAAELAARLDCDLDLEAVDEVTDEIARLAPAHKGADASLLRRAADGIVIPIGVKERPVLDGPAHAIVPAADPDPSLVGGPVESLLDVTPGGKDADGTYGPVGAPTPHLAIPPLLRWDGTVADGPAGPAPDGGLRLVTGRKLYDDGVRVRHSAAVSALAAPPTVRLNPADAGAAGVAEGGTVRVASGRGEVTATATLDGGVPAGVAWLTHSAPGAPAGELITAGTLTTVRVEVAAGVS